MMNIRTKVTNIELTEDIASYIEEKVGQLERHLGAEPIVVDVELARDTGKSSGPIYRFEVNIDMPHEKHVLRADSVESDPLAAIDTCIPKIKAQLEEEKDKRDTLIKKGGREAKEALQNMDPELL